MSTTEQSDQPQAAALVPGGAQHVNWGAVPVERPSEGIERQMVVGERMMTCRFRFAPHLVTPEHSHPHEQVVNMLDGELEMVVDGVRHPLRAGDVLTIPGGSVHSGRSLTPCRVLDVFYPVRMDYKTAE